MDSLEIDPSQSTVGGGSRPEPPRSAEGGTRQPIIRFLGVVRRYAGGQRGLDGATFDIDRGEFIFVTGGSGAGKSTLLRLIFREDLPTHGQVIVNGRIVGAIPERKIPYLRRSIGVVFQDFRLIPRKTIFENVSYLPRILGMDRGDHGGAKRAVFP